MTYDPPLDEGIAYFVHVLNEAGIDTFESCQGGPGHAYPEPTIRFHGHVRIDGVYAVSVARKYNLPVSELRLTFPIEDGNLTGPYCELTFYRQATKHEWINRPNWWKCGKLV